jgi:hypothetical protein
MRRGGKIPDYAALRPGMNVIDAVIKLIRSNPLVTRGLDPRVHPLRKDFFPKRMDCRVKPGNDAYL